MAQRRESINMGIIVRNLMLLMGLSLIAVSMFMYSIILIFYTYRVFISFVTGLFFVFMGFLIGSRAKKVAYGIGEAKSCELCNSEAGMTICARCKRWVGSNCLDHYQGIWCKDCAVCPICGSEYAMNTCFSCQKRVGELCWDENAQRCIECSGKLKTSVDKVPEKAMVGRVVVVDSGRKLPADFARLLKEGIRENIMEKVLLIGDEVDAYGAKFKIVASAPGVRVKVVDKTKIKVLG